MMEDDSSADDLLIDVDEEDFALTAEELEQAEEMLGSNTGVGIGTKMKSNTGVGIGAQMKEQAKEMLAFNAEIKDKARDGCEVRPEAGSNNMEVKVEHSVKVQAEPLPRLEASSLVHQPPGAAVTEQKASTVEVTASTMGGSKFTVKKVSTRPAGQQPFAFGKSTSQSSNKPAGTQAAFTFGNRNRPDARFGIGQAMIAATPAASVQAPRDPRRSHGTLGASSGISQARHISGLSPVSATTSAVAPIPTVAPHQEGELRTSSSIALQRMGPSALERMAAEQEKKCREENMKKEQLEKMVALKRANASSQGLVHQVSHLTQFDSNLLAG